MIKLKARIRIDCNKYEILNEYKIIIIIIWTNNFIYLKLLFKTKAQHMVSLISKKKYIRTYDASRLFSLT